MPLHPILLHLRAHERNVLSVHTHHSRCDGASSLTLLLPSSCHLFLTPNDTRKREYIQVSARSAPRPTIPISHLTPHRRRGETTVTGRKFLCRKFLYGTTAGIRYGDIGNRHPEYGRKTFRLYSTNPDTWEVALL